MLYTPDPDALPDAEPWETVYLSNRDLVAQIPINYVTHPGVSVTAACFGNGTYSSNAAQRCISNLLAAQYRRIIVDLYWDSSLRQYGLCPVKLPSSAQGTVGGGSATPGPTSATISSAQITNNPAHARRQTSTIDALTSAGLNATSTSSLSSSVAPVPTSTSGSGETLYDLGSVQCSHHLYGSDVDPLFLDFLQNTSNTIEARLLYVELNLHAAASTDAPGSPAQAVTGKELPSQSELIGQQINSSLQAFIYKPGQLLSDRANLNASWDDVKTSELPVVSYYTREKQPDGVYSTPDGWPTEAYVQLTKVLRVFLSWGTIDPQMQGYDFASDGDVLFPHGYLSTPRSIDASSDGQVTFGCFFDASRTHVNQVNSSWAVTSLDQTAALPYSELVNNVTACGITPTLNNTLSGASADNGVNPYLDFSRSAVWNWAPNEPRNTTKTGAAANQAQPQFRCALLETSTIYAGHWRVDYCTDTHRAACRIQHEPYQWVLSDQEVDFWTAVDACPDNADFSVPHTALENQYLYQHIVSQNLDMVDVGNLSAGVWVNFNSLQTEYCWIYTGPNGTCPYSYYGKAGQFREILVPTIAAIIVFVLTALTMFVKCNVNRRNSRARKRGGGGGWDYEGVPS